MSWSFKLAWPKSFQPESGECKGCAHIRQHVSGCLPEKSGWHQIASNEEWFPDLLDLAIDSNIPPTSAETAQADLLTPLSSASMESQPSRLEVIKGFHKERGFSEAVAQRLAISPRESSAGVYESKWKVFGDSEWCHMKQINPVKATVQQLADFLIFLFEEKKLAISSIQGYRSCISKVILARGIDISHDRDLNMLVKNFAIERPVQHRVAPRWDLVIVLRCLMRPPFEPMNMASLADMTRKLAFLLTLASAKRNSEVWAFSTDVRFGQDYNAATLSFLPSFFS